MKDTALSISSDFLSLLPLSTGAPNLFSVSVDLPYVNIKYKWDQMLYGLCVRFLPLSIMF